VLERGLLVIARRRFPIGIRTADERFVPASEICDVYREGDSVRVDLRSASPRSAFFQFWTGDAATAGTIVRLLPTTRTIECEGSSTVLFPARKSQSLYKRRVSARTLRWSAACVGLIGAAVLVLTSDSFWHRFRTDTEQPKPATVAVRTVPTPSVQPQGAVATEVAVAQADLARFDPRIDGLRAQYRMAFTALQYGNLSQQNFVNGLNQWLIPQWQALHTELNSSPPAAGSLDSVVRSHLLGVADDWIDALTQYALGLQQQSYVTVLGAFERMAAANQSQQEAFDAIDHAANAASK
jgi:hypothetical protein